MKTVSDPNGSASSRRRFLTDTSALGAAALLGLPRPAAAEPPPETTRIRLVELPAICLAPEYLAEELLRMEGFSEVEYAKVEYPVAPDMLLADRADISAHTAAAVLPDIDAGKPFVVLGGIHGGCEVLFGNESVRAIRDLKGKRLGVPAMVDVAYYFLAAMVAHVGMDPRKDIKWVETQGYGNLIPAFTDGRVDAVMVANVQARDLRARKIGNVLIDIGHDRPWNEYFCCIVTARKEFVAKNPIATKRALRAILKANDICAQDPERAARYLVAKGFEPNYDAALEVLKGLTYNRWRTYDVEDSLRFFGVRLYESGMIKTNPQKLVAQGTNWRFLNELKKELKA